MSDSAGRCEYCQCSTNVRVMHEYKCSRDEAKRQSSTPLPSAGHAPLSVFTYVSEADRRFNIQLED